MFNSFLNFFFYDRSHEDFVAKLQYYSCLLLSFSIPFNNFLINVAIGLLLLGWILQGGYFVSIRGIIQSPGLAALSALFFLHIAGLLYSENMSEGIFVVEKKLSLFLFPLLIGANKKINFSLADIKKIICFFVVACCIVSSLCFARGIYFWIINHTNEKLFYHELSSLFNLHAVYLSAYLIFSVFFLLYLLYDNFSKWNIYYKITSISIILFFTVIILLLSARSAIFVYILLFICFIFYSFYKKKKLPLAMLLSTLFLLLVIAMIIKIPFIYDRFYEIAESKWYFSPYENNANGFTLRIVKWSCSLQGIKENFWLGVGTGDAQDYLQMCYKGRNFWGEVFHFNSHNQFLQTGLTVGIVGLLVFIYCLIFPLVQAFIRKNFLLFIFLSIVILCSLTESFLERQQGVIFFCFFYCLLMRVNNNIAIHAAGIDAAGKTK